jgi:hypothetical protein
VQWRRLDIREALKPKAKAAEIEEALKAAKYEYGKNVELLADRLDDVVALATKYESKFKSNLLLKSSAPHLAKVAQAAKQFNAQLKLVKAEFAAFEKALQQAQKAEALAKKEDEEEALELEEEDDDDGAVPVRDVLGAKWFADLEKVAIQRGSDIDNWAANADLGLSARDDKAASNLKILQARAKRDLGAFKQALNQLRGLRARSMPREAALAEARKQWALARKAFGDPGLVNHHHEWEVRQVTNSGRDRFEAWKKKHAAAIELHEKVGKLLEEDEARMRELDTALGKLK